MQTASFPGNIAPYLHPSLNRNPWPSFREFAPRSADEVIYLVDSDQRVSEELSENLAARGMEVIRFASATEYLNFTRADLSGCLILDMHLPDVGGLELQRRLAEKSHPPIVFISGACDIPSTVQAMKAGAIEFLTKPVDPMALLLAVRVAFAQDRRLRQRKAELAKLQQCCRLLTPREREVFPLIVGGLLNKQAAAMLGISEVTLQIHRSQVMRKMEAESFADLVRMAIKLRIPHRRENQPSTEFPVRNPADRVSALHTSVA